MLQNQAPPDPSNSFKFRILGSNPCQDYSLHDCDKVAECYSEQPGYFQCRCPSGFVDLSPDKRFPGRKCKKGKSLFAAAAAAPAADKARNLHYARAAEHRPVPSPLTCFHFHASFFVRCAIVPQIVDRKLHRVFSRLNFFLKGVRSIALHLSASDRNYPGTSPSPSSLEAHPSNHKVPGP